MSVSAWTAFQMTNALSFILFKNLTVEYRNQCCIWHFARKVPTCCFYVTVGYLSDVDYLQKGFHISPYLVVGGLSGGGRIMISRYRIWSAFAKLFPRLCKKKKSSSSAIGAAAVLDGKWHFRRDELITSDVACVRRFFFFFYLIHN